MPGLVWTQSTIDLRTPASTTTGLDWPGVVNSGGSSDTNVANTMYLGWGGGSNSSLGTVAAPAYDGFTAIFRRVIPRHKAGNSNQQFQSLMFLANDFAHGAFDAGTQCIGTHPYGGDAGSDYRNGSTPLSGYRWEVADGTDLCGSLVDFDTECTVVVTLEASGADDLQVDLYYAWPNTTTDDTNGGGAHMPLLLSGFFSKTAPTNRMLMVGGNPWAGGVGGPLETFDGVVGGLTICTTKLTTTQIADALTNPASAPSLWYYNNSWTPSDVTDKSGNGNHPAWVNLNRPTLHTY